MGVLDKIRSYQKLVKIEQEPTATPQPSMPDISQVGATLPPDDYERSFLQQFILQMFEQNHVPVAALKFIPGFGEKISGLLYGNPYEAHTFFADMHYQVGQLLDQDKQWDPVELVRRKEFAEAQARSEQRRASAEPSASGTLDGVGPYGEWKEHTFRPATFPLYDALSDEQSVDHRQQAEIQGSMGNGRSDSEETL